MNIILEQDMRQMVVSMKQLINLRLEMLADTD